MALPSLMGMPGQIVPPMMPSPINNTSGSTTGSGSNTTTSAGSQMNVYTPAQQQLQNMLNPQFANFFAGRIPTALTAPPSVLQAWQDQFKDQIEPGIVAQFGGGSPQIASQQAYGTEQLLANLYQQGVGNYLSGMGLEEQAAFNPVGSNYSGMGSSSYNNQGSFNNMSGSGFMPTVMSGAAGLGQNLLKGLRI